MHTFTSTSPVSFTLPWGLPDLQVLLTGDGGGGGQVDCLSSCDDAGGGGAGGAVTDNSAVPVSEAEPVTVSVGGGGVLNSAGGTTSLNFGGQARRLRGGDSITPVTSRRMAATPH